ncbi:hypothetical protein TorRG33x02_002000 [Trema orientale]|uniref:Uncharacterized protein n=1 Tax=Trema orientale TaxID=63057 RepID=A0A2P5G1J0_TREOI|nr:hypothetical protein TorRG33x02_002000 [Trema orientale]
MRTTFIGRKGIGLICHGVMYRDVRIGFWSGKSANKTHEWRGFKLKVSKGKWVTMAMASSGMTGSEGLRTFDDNRQA